MQKLLLLLLLFFSSTTLAQFGYGDGSDPAVTNRFIEPAPLQGLGSQFTIGFVIGNNGTVPISGVGEGITNRMQFSICLAKCAPNPASTAALSGELLDYFDVSYNAASNCFGGIQKQNVEIPLISVYNLSIAAVVTKASTERFVNDIGAACSIAPHQASGYQPTANDFAAVYTTTIDIALPVSLISFRAQATPERSVLISWQTAWERANKGFVIERSKDLVNFDLIGQVNDVAGNSSDGNTYQFVDSSPYRGTSYYRLRQVDQDGSSQTFKAESVIINARYGIYPNPVAGQQFTLELDEPIGAVIRLYSANGNEIKLREDGSTQTSVMLRPAAHLPTGVYMLMVEERGATRTHRLIVQP